MCTCHAAIIPKNHVDIAQTSSRFITEGNSRAGCVAADSAGGTKWYNRLLFYDVLFLLIACRLQDIHAEMSL